MIESNHKILFVKILHHLIYKYELLVILDLYVFEKMLYLYQIPKEIYIKTENDFFAFQQTIASVFNNFIGTGG